MVVKLEMNRAQHRRRPARKVEESAHDRPDTGGSVQRLQFRAFDRDFNVTLHPSPDLISPNFMVVIRGGGNNNTREMRPDLSHSSLSSCLYRSDVSLVANAAAAAAAAAAAGYSRPSDARENSIRTAAFDLCQGAVMLPMSLIIAAFI